MKESCRRCKHLLCTSLAMLATGACNMEPRAQPPFGVEQVFDPGPLPGQVVPHPSNPSWLARNGEGPLFICGPGDPEDFLYRGWRRADGSRAGDQPDLIRRLEGTGANSVYVQAVRSHGGDGEADHNPFVGSDPRRGLNAAILDQWSGWFEALQEAGVVIYFFIYDDSARIWDTGDAVGFEERAFVEALVDRFEHLPLLVWVVAEEYEERYSSERVRALARVIREADDHDHLVAVHKLAGLDFEEFRGEPAVGHYALQWRGSHTSILEGARQVRRAVEGDKSFNMAEIADHGTGREARLKNWAAAMGGAAGVMVLAWFIHDTPLSDLEDCGRLVRFMESTNLGALAPDTTRAAPGTWTLSDSVGEERVIFVTEEGSDLRALGVPQGRYEVRWTDPADAREPRRDTLNHEGGALSIPLPPELRGADAVIHLRPAG